MVIAWKLIWYSHDEENDIWMVHDVWVTVNDNFYKIYDKRWMIAKMTHINKIMLAHPIDQSEWYQDYIVYTGMLSMSIIYNDVMKEQMKNAMS